METIGTRKLIRGVATNDADYQVVKSEKINGKWKTVWECPIYKRWLSVL
jgi:mRNA-degrading endonuclease YafQ of YafQ-DinJ toxin-antitoxin module